MSVNYNEEIATAYCFTLFRLFFKWKGSIFKLIWHELIIYVLVFYMIQLIYVYALNDTAQHYFEILVLYTRKFDYISVLSLLLGFFVTNVMRRWWDQYMAIPWPTKLSVYVTTLLHGYDEVGRAMRRTIVRYVNLSLCMVLRVLSPRVKRRFPKMDDLIIAGLINENELSILQNLERKYPGYSKNWLPICWAANLAIRARNDGRIKNDFELKTIIDEINAFRANCVDLLNFSEICIPLVYVQVVSAAVITAFATSFISHQPLLTIKEENGRVVREMTDFYFLENSPFLAVIQFIVYSGWLRIAHSMINPFGEDDNDFDVNTLIDKNLIMSYMIVDDMHNDHPELLKDQYWDKLPNLLPDIARELKKDTDSFLHQKDIFDVKEAQSGLRQRKASLFPVDTENIFTQNIVQSKTDFLIPRPDVIDDTYKRLDVNNTQSALNKKMQKIREENLRSRQSSETEEVKVENEKRS